MRNTHCAIPLLIAQTPCYIAHNPFVCNSVDHVMAKKITRDRISERDIAEIIAAVERHPSGASRDDIAKGLPRKLAPRTLQFWLRNLVASGRLSSEGAKRGMRYYLPTVAPADSGAAFSSPTEK